jgi:hypothetical protein
MALYITTISLLFVKMKSVKVQTENGKEITTINLFFQEMFDGIAKNKSSTAYLLYKEELGKYSLDLNEKGHKLLFYLDAGDQRRFYIGANVFPQRRLQGRMSVSDFISSENISKVLVHLEIYYDDIEIKNFYVNNADVLINSSIKPDIFNCKRKLPIPLNLNNYGEEEIKESLKSLNLNDLDDLSKHEKLHEILHQKLGIINENLQTDYVKNTIITKANESKKTLEENTLYDLLQSTNFGFPTK